MELFDDINTYYPEVEKDPMTSYEDFRIFRMENMVLDKDGGVLNRLRSPHRRDFFEFSIVKEEIKSVAITIGKDKFKGVDNNVFFTSPHQVFSIDFSKRKKEEIATGFLVAFKPSFLLKERRGFEVMNTFSFYNSHTTSHYILEESDLEEIMYLMHNIYNEYSNNEIYAKSVIKGYLEALLHSFNRLLQLNSNKVTTSSSKNIVSRFEQKVIESGNTIGTIKEYASALNISPNYLSICVKNETNKSAKEIILIHKLIVAKSLLSQSEKNIAEVAYEMGYSEPTNFTKFFKQMAGMTPNQFRNSN